MKKIFLFTLVLTSIIYVNAQCWQMAKAGYAQTLAIKDDGTLWAWGQTLLYTPNFDGGIFLQPTQVGADHDWKLLSPVEIKFASIETHPLTFLDFNESNPFIDEIKKTGIDLIS